MLRWKAKPRAKTNQVLQKLKFIGWWKSFLAVVLAGFSFCSLRFWFSNWLACKFSSTFHFSFLRCSKFWLIVACDYLAYLSVKSLRQKFFSSALFLVVFCRFSISALFSWQRFCLRFSGWFAKVRFIGNLVFKTCSSFLVSSVSVFVAFVSQPSCQKFVSV